MDVLLKKTEKLNFFNKTLQFSDINYQLASDEDQEYIFEVYSEILNYFEDDVWFQLTFESRRRDNEVFIKKIDIPDKKDDYDEIRREYSEIIKNLLTEGENGTEIVKFLTFGMFAKDITEARSKLKSIGTEIINLFKKADVTAKTLNGSERLAVMYRALNPYRRNRFMFDWNYARKIGANTKDFISPSSIVFGKKDFELGDCYGSVMSVNLIASELKDRILYDFLNLNQLICLNIHVKPFDVMAGQKIIRRLVFLLMFAKNKL
ncbi:MAG: hypothetical protein LBM93_10195 [Oscillospiraceae bacterium]|jgi:hypothetical protein|nr:hypothetical protein [Oscillospiraceae bacterium]